MTYGAVSCYPMSTHDTAMLLAFIDTLLDNDNARNRRTKWRVEAST